MSTEKCRTNEPHRFRLSLSDKLNLKNPNKNMALIHLSIYHTWKTLNLDTTIINLKYLLHHGMINLISLMDPYSAAQIQDYFEYIVEKHEAITDNPPIQIYVNKIKNNTVFKIKTGYKLELVLKKQLNYWGVSKKTLIKIKTENMSQT